MVANWIRCAQELQGSTAVQVAEVMRRSPKLETERRSAAVLGSKGAKGTRTDALASANSSLTWSDT